MQLAAVIGHATSTIKHPSLDGWRLTVVQPLAVSRAAEGDPVIAIDRLGTAPGHTVLINNDGIGARQLVGHEKSPVRWFICGIVDE